MDAHCNIQPPGNDTYSSADTDADDLCLISKHDKPDLGAIGMDDNFSAKLKGG